MLSEIKANESAWCYALSGSSASSNKAQLAQTTSFHLAEPPLNQEDSALLASRSTAQLFDSSSGNNFNDSHLNAAGRDIINLSVHINPYPPLTTPSQEAPVMPELPNQPVFQWPSIIWQFLTPFFGTAVTLHAPESATVGSPSKPQAKPSISPDPTERQPFLIQQTPALEARPSQANAQVHREASPSESEGKGKIPEPRDTGFDAVSICTPTFVHDL
jgi:hypothetical protein